MKKIKEYRIHSIHRGIQYESCVITTSKKKAAEILDVSSYEMNTYGYHFDARSDFEPDEHFAMPERSGENAYIFDNDEFGKPIPIEEFYERVKSYRKKFSTYKQAAEYHEKINKL